MNLVKRKALKSNIFSMYMSRGGGKDSELCIGCVDSAMFSGKVEYYPLNPKATKNIQYYWNIKVCFSRIRFSHAREYSNG